MKMTLKMETTSKVNSNIKMITIKKIPMKTAQKMKTTPKMDIPQKNTPKNVEDLSEVKRTSK